MHLKLGTTLALAGLFAISPGIAAGGSVQTGMLSSSNSINWACGEDAHLSAPNSETSCGSAKFGKCSDCDDLAIRNQSGSPVKLHIKIIGSGFAQPCAGGGAYGYGYEKCASGTSIRVGDGNPCGDSLKPGQSCRQSIEFCPAQAGESHGEVRVSVTTGSGSPHLQVFKLVGSGDYPPELAAADQARRSQLDELMKIPYVAKVELDTENDDLAINVEVTEDDKIEQVRRLVPPKIEGYRTEVTTYSPVGCGY
ncbi:MAG TPA: hypothetical protein VMV27_08375 [Candidatus Binataceae bacterium]|nr:hypothetical protein [Candidatus Binataceae bacterium]